MWPEIAPNKCRRIIPGAPSVLTDIVLPDIPGEIKWKSMVDHTQTWYADGTTLEWNITLWASLGVLTSNGVFETTVTPSEPVHEPPEFGDGAVHLETAELPANTPGEITFNLLDKDAYVVKWAQVNFLGSFSYRFQYGLKWDGAAWYPFWIPYAKPDMTLSQVFNFHDAVWTFDTNGPVKSFNAIQQLCTPYGDSENAGFSCQPKLAFVSILISLGEQIS